MMSTKTAVHLDKQRLIGSVNGTAQGRRRGRGRGPDGVIGSLAAVIPNRTRIIPYIPNLDTE